MTLISWLKNRKNYSDPKKLNLKSILNYAEAEYQSWKSTSKFLDADKHIEEQSIWRLSQIKEKSPICLEGSCILCGCSTQEKSFEMGKCNGGCYPIRMSAIEWNKFKKKNNIEVC